MRQVCLSASVLGLTVLGLSLGGCPDRTISEVNPQQGRVEYKDIPVTVNRNVDILFVIDDSGSMADKQTNLAANFPNFINVLNTIQGGLPDVHIGVVTSDVGTKGTQDAAPGAPITGTGGCSGTGKSGNLQLGQAGALLQPGQVFISDIKLPNGTRQVNYNGTLPVAFGEMAKVGKEGCGFEQHLEAMKRALNNNPANAGFLRPDAYLAVIFIADEDDCSMSHSSLLVPDNAPLGKLGSFRCTRFGVTCDQNGSTTDAMNQVGTKGQCHPNDNSAYLEKVSTYVDFLKNLKSDPSRIIVAGIIGTPEPFQVELRVPSGSTAATQALAHSCNYQGASGLEVADPPTRIKFLLDQFPNRNTTTTICQQNLTDGLVLIAQLLKSALGDPCITAKLADVDPNTPGPQYDCSVSDVTNFGKANQVETVLPQCEAGNTNKPCWRIANDQMDMGMPPMLLCPAGDHFSLKIERNEAPAPETHVISYCVTEAT